MKCNFRENLRGELKYQGVTIKELSARTGIPVASLDCYLGARATVPSVDTAVKIAKALKVSVEDLVIGENTNIEKSKPSREAQEIAHWAKSLNIEQCKAVLKLINIFKLTSK